jgi:PAS domain S-box-containing protein
MAVQAWDWSRNLVGVSMSPRARTTSLDYIWSVLFTALALLLRWSLDPWLGPHLPFVTLYAAVAAAVWYGGYRPAIASVLLGYLAADYWFIEPRGSLSLHTAREQIVLVLYLSTCSIVIGFGEAVRRTLVRARLSRQEIEQEIAQRRKAEEHVSGLNRELRVAKSELEIVTDCMSASVTRCSRDLKYIWVSQPYADWIGRSRAEIHGQSIQEVLGPAVFENLLPYFQQVLSGVSVQYEEEVNYHALGRRWVHATYSPTFDKFGKPDGWVAVIVDIDARKRAEDALQQSNRKKDEFLATLAHELRNPLAPIRNAVDLLRLVGTSDAELQAARDIIDRQATQMTRLVDDLLEVSRITQGKVQLRRELIALSSAVQNAVEATQPLIQDLSHELTVTCDDEPIYVDADPTRLTQIIANLLNNAAKYTQRGGHIWLKVERQAESGIVSVRDTGIGIASEQLPHVFEMFSQEKRALEHAQGGLGIGLALVKGLVELHRGSVEVCSDGPGLGSEFIVRLPCVQRSADTSLACREQPAKSLMAPTHRILVVDDNRDSVESMSIMLRLLGHDVYSARDGLEAVQAAASVLPDVVLLDIGLPNMNGYEAARQIRKHRWGENIVLIALTGWGQEEDRKQALDAGFDHHFTKPMDIAAIHSILLNSTPTDILVRDCAAADTS